MVIYKAKDYQDMSRKAANIISAQIIMKPNCVLGLATGSSPVGTYKRLIEWYEKGDLDFSQVTSINLDEYKGLSPENDQSYRYFMQHNLFDHIDVRPECTHVPNGLAEDAEAPSRGSEIKRVRTCCRGCGKMECGVWVTVENGRAIKSEGDQSSFQSSGNHCGKGQASIQAAYHPDRIYHPLKRTNPKGEDPGWVRITWDEAMDTIGEKFTEIIDQYGGQSIFNMCGTSRQWVYGPYCFYKLSLIHI